MHKGTRMTLMALLGAFSLATMAQGEVKVEKVTYYNLPNCYKLSNGTVEIIVTTDIGPRILRYAFIGAENILGELSPDVKVTTELGDWRPYGGHRLWIAPESKRLSYSPDNEPISWERVGSNGLRLLQPIEPKTGIRKEMTVLLDDSGTRVTIHHKLTNLNLFPMEIAPWALTIMNGGGVTILPQEPYISHDDYVLPARPMVLWHYTDLTDPRWSIGKRYIRLRTDENRPESQKIGILCKQGWAAYHRKGTLFVKRFAYAEGANYPDYGSNCETYTSGSFMEIETLAPLHKLALEQSAEHVEHWFLFKNVDIGTSEASLDAAITPLVRQTEHK
jgi:hypothetical protein